MATGKTNTLTFCIELGLKEALRTAADRERRSIANMVEVRRALIEAILVDCIVALPSQLFYSTVFLEN